MNFLSIFNSQFFVPFNCPNSILCDDFFVNFDWLIFLSSIEFCKNFNFFCINLNLLLFQHLRIAECTSRFSISFFHICITLVYCFLAICTLQSKVLFSPLVYTFGSRKSNLGRKLKENKKKIKRKIQQKYIFVICVTFGYSRFWVFCSFFDLRQPQEE